MLAKFKMKKKDWTGIFLTARVQRLYKEYENNIISGLESASGLSFRRGFTVVVSDVTGDYLILWLLIHEIGHRLLDQHGIETPIVKNQDIFNEQEHRLLFSFLIDAMEIGFGSQRTKAIIKAGPERGYHTRAWKWAVNMTPKQRKAAWKKLKVSYSHSSHTL